MLLNHSTAQSYEKSWNRKGNNRFFSIIPLYFD